MHVCSTLHSTQTKLISILGTSAKTSIHLHYDMMMFRAVLTANHYKNELLGKGHINLLTQFSGDMKAEIRLFRRLNDFQDHNRSK